ncbi:MAG: hypothetical protein AB1553_15365 [Nitrospirota bacterium]
MEKKKAPRPEEVKARIPRHLTMQCPFMCAYSAMILSARIASTDA